MLFLSLVTENTLEILHHHPVEEDLLKMLIMLIHIAYLIAKFIAIIVYRLRLRIVEKLSKTKTNRPCVNIRHWLPRLTFTYNELISN